MHNKLRLRVSKRKSLILLAIFVFMTVIGGVMSPIAWDAREKGIETLNSEIIPFPVDTSKTFKLHLSEGTIFTYEGADLAKGFGLNELFPFNLNFTDSKFSINFVDGEMLLSADIIDSSGRLIAKIVNNTWTTVDPSIALQFSDRNYNAYAFEIIGSNNIPTLQVAMIGSNEIQIGGLFYTKSGSIYIAPKTDGAVMYFNVGTDHREENASINSLFKYPCLTNESNLGKMKNSYYPSSDPLILPTCIFICGILFAFLGITLSFFAWESYNYQNNKDKEKKLTHPKSYIKQHNPYSGMKKRRGNKKA